MPVTNSLFSEDFAASVTPTMVLTDVRDQKFGKICASLRVLLGSETDNARNHHASGILGDFLTKVESRPDFLSNPVTLEALIRIANLGYKSTDCFNQIAKQHSLKILSENLDQIVDCLKSNNLVVSSVACGALGVLLKNTGKPVNVYIFNKIAENINFISRLLDYTYKEIYSFVFPLLGSTLGVIDELKEDLTADQIYKVVQPAIVFSMKCEDPKVANQLAPILNSVFLENQNDIFPLVNLMTCTALKKDTRAPSYVIDEMASKWLATSNTPFNWVMRNIAAFGKLEAMAPGIVHGLYNDFGIRCLARYDKDHLLSQSELPYSKKTNLFGIWCISTYDWMGTWEDYSPCMQRLRSEMSLQKGTLLNVETASYQELAMRMFKLANQDFNNEAMFLVWSNHGDVTGIDIGPEIESRYHANPKRKGKNHDREETSPPKTTLIRDDFISSKITFENQLSTLLIKSSLQETAPVVIESCYNGRSKGFARTLSSALERLVYAPPDSAWFDELSPIIKQGKLVGFTPKSCSGVRVGKFYKGHEIKLRKPNLKESKENRILRRS